MQQLYLPGQMLVTDFGGYQHYSLVSDRFCSDGKPMLISATSRNGTVLEEQFDIVTGGKPTYATGQAPYCPHRVLDHARSMIGRWEYDVLNNNCEHFANWATGHGKVSMQVRFGLAGTCTAMVIVALTSKKPEFAKYALAVTGLTVLAIWCARAEKTVEQHRIP